MIAPRAMWMEKRADGPERFWAIQVEGVAGLEVLDTGSARCWVGDRTIPENDPEFVGICLNLLKAYAAHSLNEWSATEKAAPPAPPA